MAQTKTLGGDRLGAGKKMKVHLHNFERSTHDLGYVWRSTMAPGTLVPFMNLIGLPGDTFDIDLGADVKTYPTAGPLFGSFKLQLDVFVCPIRLYQGQLHNNKLGIGMNMSQIKLPLLEIEGNAIKHPNVTSIPADLQQINQSSLLAYLGIRGLGNLDDDGYKVYKNATSFLAYWDIYKNYYANKQEEIGVCIHANTSRTPTLSYVETILDNGTSITSTAHQDPSTIMFAMNGVENFVIVSGTNLSKDNLTVTFLIAGSMKFTEAFENITDGGGEKVYGKLKTQYIGQTLDAIGIDSNIAFDDTIELETFPLSNIDDMREDILAAVKNTNPFMITKNSPAPYGLPLKHWNTSRSILTSQLSQEGLGIKTYQSDIFNNWLSTDWIDGANGISAVTAIDTSSGNFTLDTLNLSQKVYEMLNRIAVSGGSYDDWLEAVYSHDIYRRAESPIYMGGLSKEVVFQEVVSSVGNTEDGVNNPLGTLGGKGTMSKKHKGGQVNIKIEEPSVIIGIVSLTPRIDYSQGNDWTTRLKTMDDFHKPSLDQIGFQELITEQMAAWDTEVHDSGNVEILHSAGKQPAWINYMTNFNKCYGNFADPRSEMFMTLNRRYERDENTGRIKDLTTYIDPVKFNYAFAQADLTAQNFWVQLGCDIIARRKMSSKVMPNL